MKINKYIDLTLLKATATSQDIINLCETAKQYSVKSVCVNPSYVPLVKEQLLGSDVLTCTVIGFPLGATTTNSKVFEAQEAINNGADEVDVVINVGKIKEHAIDYLTNELTELRKLSTTIKIIVETCYLSNEEVVMMTELCDDLNLDFIKTSTGFGTGGATEEDIKLMHQNITGNLKIKASGGIKTNEQAVTLIEAGASRIGASSVEVIND